MGAAELKAGFEPTSTAYEAAVLPVELHQQGKVLPRCRGSVGYRTDTVLPPLAACHATAYLRAPVRHQSSVELEKGGVLRRLQPT
jgi:hypothetical protein